VHEDIVAPTYPAHAVVALSAHVAAVHVTVPPLLLPLPVLLPVLLPVPPPLLLLLEPPSPVQATGPVIAKQMGAPSAKQQFAVNPLRPSPSSVHDSTVAPG
jgi:hypothetical protein